MLKITLMRSVIGAKPVNRKTVSALGLRKTGRTIYREDVPSIRGMIHNVRHLVKVETVDAAPAKVAKPKKVKAAKPAPKAVVAPAPKSATHEPKPAKKPAAKKPAAKKPAPKNKPAAKKPAPKAPARKADTERKSFGEVGKKKKKES